VTFHIIYYLVVLPLKPKYLAIELYFWALINILKNQHID